MRPINTLLSHEATGEELEWNDTTWLIVSQDFIHTTHIYIM